MPSTESAQELEERLKSGVTAMLEQLAEGKSEHYLLWEKFASRFHRYSFRNQFLIAMQKPDATYVAGFGAWKKMDKSCYPHAGTGIHILAPRTVMVTDPDTGEKEQRIIGFKDVTVFDVSDVENAPEIPEFFSSLGDAPQGLKEYIMAAMEQDGITVTETERIAGAGRALGMSSGGRVQIVNSTDELNQCTTLIHEWMHEILHQSMLKKDKDAYMKLTTRQKECHAEAGTFIIFNALGIEVTHSADYLINHGNDADTFIAELTFIMNGVKKIMAVLDKFKPVAAVESVAA